MRPGHPERVRLEAFQREFGLGDSLYVYFHDPRPPGSPGPSRVFSAEGLRAIRDLSGRLERTDGVNRVLSAVDLLAPEIRDDHLRLIPLLDSRTLNDPARTAQVLSRPPFVDRWIGSLYDRDQTVLTLLIRPDREYEDPRRTLGLLKAIQVELDGFKSSTGVDYHLNGLFYLNGEMVRSTFHDQGKLTAIGIGLLLACFWFLLGRLALALACLFVVGVAILIAFGVMVLLGVPMNGLSGNLPVLTLVNGLEDVVHLLAIHLAVSRRAGRRRAAATSLAACLVPNFLTSLTTFGALIVTGATDLVLIQAFGFAICIGVVVEYVVAILFLPLLLARLKPADRRAPFFRIQSWIERVWIQKWSWLCSSRLHLTAWLALAVGLVGYSAGQRVNSNWYRYFVESHPVSQTLRFLEERGFPVTTVDVTVPAGMPLRELLKADDLEREVEGLASAIEKFPDVTRVDAWTELKRFIDARLAEVQFPPGLSEPWRQARREAFYRQYAQLRVFDEHYAPSSQKLRLAVATRTGDALGLLDLGERIRQQARQFPAEKLETDQLEVSGSMAYWGAIMGYVSNTFYMNLAYSLAFVYVVFLCLTGSFTVGTLAMIPNVLPLFAMYSAARGMGYELSESFCVINSLAIGNSVNDTIHYLVHVQRHLRAGSTVLEAQVAAFREVGQALIVSSVFVAAGFLSCLFAQGVPVILSGVYMCVACLSAVLFDVFLFPSLLSRVRPWK